MTRLLDHAQRAVENQARPTPVSSKFAAPEFLLFLVIAFLLWSVGFVDLLAHPVADPRYAVVGPYSKGVAALIAAYGLLFLIGLAVVLIPGSHITIFRVLAYVQDRNWLALAVTAGLLVALCHVWTQPSWLKYPGLSTTVLLFLLLVGAIFLLWRWRESGTARFWRRSVAALIVALVALELVVQALAFVGLMPGAWHLDGGYVPQGRIYQSREGRANGTANNFGWYYPDFRLDPGSHRIGVIGDSFIQALQIDPEQHLGVQLEKYLNDAGGEETEVLALGHPGYGPGLYLDLEMLEFALQAFDLAEIIVVLHLGNDLRNLTKPSELDVYFSLPPDGEVAIHRDSFNRWHDVAHYVLTGYEPLHPIRVLKSHYLTPSLWHRWRDRSRPTANAPASARPLDIPGVRGVVTRQSRTTVRGHTTVLAMDLVETPGWSNFLFEKEPGDDAEQAYEITRRLLQRFHHHARARGVALRLVTIPVFPAAFYQSYAGGPWTADLGAYDLFRPEKMLVAFAREHDIPVLAMGQTMVADGVTVPEMQGFYYANGTGHLTPQGHTYFAAAIHACFYANDHELASGVTSGCLRGRD